MKRIAFIIISMFMGIGCFAQSDGRVAIGSFNGKEELLEESTPSSSEKAYDVVEQMPAFPGGMGVLMLYLSSKIKYPKDAEAKHIQGRVICTFVVEQDGSISNVNVERSVYPSIDNEAIRVISNMPRWEPGKKNGTPVRVKYVLPITFRYK